MPANITDMAISTTIRIPLTTDQAHTASAGYVDLTDAQIKSAWAQRSTALRTTRASGKLPTCECGRCRKCYLRVKQRERRQRASG